MVWFVVLSRIQSACPTSKIIAWSSPAAGVAVVVVVLDGAVELGDSSGIKSKTQEHTSTIDSRIDNKPVRRNISHPFVRKILP